MQLQALAPATHRLQTEKPEKRTAMSCETETAVVLRDAGQKITPQRMLILSTLRHAGEHVTATRRPRRGAPLVSLRRRLDRLPHPRLRRRARPRQRDRHGLRRHASSSGSARTATTTSSAAPAAALPRSTTATSMASQPPSTTNSASRPTSATSRYSASAPSAARRTRRGQP